MSDRIAHALALYKAAQARVGAAIRDAYPPGAAIKWLTQHHGMQHGHVDGHSDTLFDMLRVRNRHSGRIYWIKIAHVVRG